MRPPLDDSKISKRWRYL